MPTAADGQLYVGNLVVEGNNARLSGNSQRKASGNYAQLMGQFSFGMWVFDGNVRNKRERGSADVVLEIGI